MINEFLEGLCAPLVGLGWLKRVSALRRYAWIPFLLNAVLTAVLLYAAFREVGVVHDLIGAKLSTIWGGRLVTFLLDVLLVVLALGIGAGSMLLLSGLLCGVAYSYLAERVERELGTPAAQLHGVSIVGETLDTLASALELGLVSVGVVLLPLVPVVGAPLAPFAAWYFDTFIFGMKQFEFALGARGMRRSDIRAFARRHRAHTLGLGTAVFLLSLVPLLGALALPAAVIGATALAHRLLATEVSTKLPR